MKGSCHVLSLGSPPSLSCPLLSIPRGVRATGWHTHGLEAQLGGRLGSSLPEQRLMEPLQFALILILMHTSFFLGRESIPFTRSSRVSRSLKCLNHRYIWRDKLFATFHEHLLCAGQELRDSSNSTSAKKCLIKKKKSFLKHKTLYILNVYNSMSLKIHTCETIATIYAMNSPITSESFLFS